MHSDLQTINLTGPGWVKTAVGFALFAGFGIALHGILLSVEYRWVKVLDVRVLAGRDVSVRMVLVETPDRMRLLRTSDPYIVTQKGAFVCMSQRRLIARRWMRYAPELPGYCRNKPRPVAPQSIYKVD